MTKQGRVEQLREAIDQARKDLLDISYAENIDHIERTEKISKSKIVVNNAWKAWRSAHRELMRNP